MVEKVDGITHLSFFLVTSQTHISFYKYSPQHLKNFQYLDTLLINAMYHKCLLPS